MNLFGQIIGGEEWSFLRQTLTPSQLVDLFQYYTGEIIDVVFPEQKVRIKDEDKPYFTEQLRILKRQQCPEYNKNGKSNKYKSLVERFESLLKTDILKHKQKLKSRYAHVRSLNSYSYPLIKC